MLLMVLEDHDMPDSVSNSPCETKRPAVGPIIIEYIRYTGVAPHFTLLRPTHSAVPLYGDDPLEWPTLLRFCKAPTFQEVGRNP
jgi:hypothetical protein